MAKRMGPRLRSRTTFGSLNPAVDLRQLKPQFPQLVTGPPSLGVRTIHETVHEVLCWYFKAWYSDVSTTGETGIDGFA